MFFETDELCRGRCPNSECQSTILFREDSAVVKCRVCNVSCNFKVAGGPRPERVEVARAADDEGNWLRERAIFMETTGGFGNGRSEMYSRSIDGILNKHHAQRLAKHFSNCGIDENNNVRRLSEMGRSEPIDVVNLSDYAFAIEKEHVNVPRYGKDRPAAHYLSKTVEAIKKFNYIDDNEQRDVVILTVPEQDRLCNAASLASRACVGRNVFGERIFEEMIANLQKFANEYQKRADCDPRIWFVIKGATARNYESIAFEGPWETELDLASLANVLRRSILLLDGEHPFAVKTFVPFLFHPDDCRNRKGRKRSPLLFAWANRPHMTLSILVSTIHGGRISPIRLPRRWFANSVWGARDQGEIDGAVDRYLQFDANDRCLVASGKYFRPEFLRRIVNGFEKAIVAQGEVHPRLVAEWMRDFQSLSADKASVETSIVSTILDGKLFRCSECECLTPKPMINDDCPSCGAKGSLRKQFMDGSAARKNGDHTDTPAPKSWCFRRRKHFFDGKEYDNPRVEIRIEMALGDQQMDCKAYCFVGDSNPALNTTPIEAATQIVDQLQKKGMDATEILPGLLSEVKIKMDNIAFRQCLDLKDCMPHGRRLDDLLDGQRQSRFVAPTPIGRVYEDDTIVAHSVGSVYEDDTIVAHSEIDSSSVASVLEVASVAMKFYHDQVNKPMSDPVADRELRSEVEKAACENLSNMLLDCDQEKRWRVLGSRKDAFYFGGFFYHYAQGRNNRNAHFKLPSMGDAQFSFATDTKPGDKDDHLVVCIPGGHFPVHESVDAMCLLLGEGVKFPCDSKGHSNL